MLATDALTPTQQRIVQHDEGPALVFAVAGAGKTTAMVHRIRHLVDERGVPPERILASSFSRATVSDLEDGLHTLGVRGVECRTLHALGRRCIQHAEARKHLPPRLNEQSVSPGNATQYLAERALKRLAREREIDVADLGIPQPDLVDQIGAWKRQLCYADLSAAHLPESAQEHASQAEHENDDYLTLYRYAEEERDNEGWITFDDMLREGWEALMRFSAVREAAQSAYEYVLVDEFQDVSRVQYRMLDVLTAPHRNYMAIGDDDQCIYTWRGADPSYILDFSSAYNADEYMLHDNFRSPVQQTALANRVIAHNTERQDKRIQCTKGYGGTTQCTAAQDAAEEGTRIASTIQSHLRAGRAPTDIVILVRQYAQTPFIEQALLEAEVPHRIVGNTPFYERPEVQTLLQYLYWATLESTVQGRGWFADRRKVKAYLDRFQTIIRTPNRYVSYAVLQNVARASRTQQTSVLDALAAHTDQMHERTVEQVEDFLETASSLAARVNAPAADTLSWLIDAIDYDEHLREQSAFRDVGENRVATAQSLVGFADGYASAQALLEAIYRISQSHANSDPAATLTLRSIHRAKGGEWPVVFVPGCTTGTFPPAGTETDTRLMEEERRLFYVAVTRAQEELHLSHVESDPRSPFLGEARPDATLAQCDALQTVAETDPASLTPEDAVRFCMAVGALGLARYVRSWWDPPAGFRERLIECANEAEATVKEKLRDGDATDLLIPVAKRAESVSATRPFTFAASSHTGRIEVYQRDWRIGFVDVERSDQHVPLDLLPWDTLTAHLARRTTSGETLYLRLGTAPTNSDQKSSEDPASSDATGVFTDSYQQGKTAVISAM